MHGHNVCISGASWVLILLNVFFIDVDDGMKSILTVFTDDTKGRRVFGGTAACGKVGTQQAGGMGRQNLLRFGENTCTFRRIAPCNSVGWELIV